MPIYKMDGKKDGKQQYRVRINYIDNQGVAKQIDRVAYGNAEAKLLEINLKKELKNQGTSSSMTVNELFDEYIAYKKHEVRETTLDKTVRILRGHVLNTIGEVKLDKLTISRLQKWKNTISETDLAIKTKKNIFGEFRAMLNYAVKVEYINKNLLSNVGNFKDAYVFEDIKQLHYYTPEQFKLYIANAYNADNTLMEWGYYVFFNIAFYTGMRKGEINALKWSDIEGNILHVRRSIAQKIKGPDRETPPKTSLPTETCRFPFHYLKY